MASFAMHSSMHVGSAPCRRAYHTGSVDWIQQVILHTANFSNLAIA